MAFGWGPDGRLRVSHASDKDEKLSRQYQPVYKHTRFVHLREGEVRHIEVALKPYGIQWKVR